MATSKNAPLQNPIKPKVAPETTSGDGNVTLPTAEELRQKAKQSKPKKTTVKKAPVIVPETTGALPTKSVGEEPVLSPLTDDYTAADMEIATDTTDGVDVLAKAAAAEMSVEELEPDLDITEELDEDEDTEEPVTTPAVPAKAPRIKLQTGSVSVSASRNPLSNVKVNNNIKTNDNVDLVINHYFNNKGSFAVNNRKNQARTCLPYSGIYVDISALSTDELLTFYNSSDNYTFIEKLTNELYIIFNHLVKSSHKNPEFMKSFDTFCESITFLDIWPLYWGLYAANSAGPEVIDIACDRCGSVIKVDSDPINLTHVGKHSEADIKDKDILDCRNGIASDLIRSKNIADEVHSFLDEETRLPESKFGYTLKMPSIKRVLDYLSYLYENDIVKNDKILYHIVYPISTLNSSSRSSRGKNGEIIKPIINDIEYDIILNQKMFTLIDNLSIPVPVPDGSGGLKLNLTNLSTTNDEQSLVAYGLLNTLSSTDIEALDSNDIMGSMACKEGIEFLITDYTCQFCPDVKQRDTSINVRDQIFTGASKRFRKGKRMLLKK